MSKQIKMDDAIQYAELLEIRIAPSVDTFTDTIERAFYAGAVCGFSCAGKLQNEECDINKLTRLTQEMLHKFFSDVTEALENV